MSIIDRVFVGRVVKDFGILCETSRGMLRQKTTVLLAERGGELKLVFKISSRALLAAGVSYAELPASAIPQLRQWLDEAQTVASQHGGPHRTAPE